MRSARIVLATVLFGCCAALGAEQAYRADVGGGVLRLLTDSAGSAFGVLCAAGRCALVLYPSHARFANGDALRVEVSVDGGPARVVDGIAFEDRGPSARGGLGVAFRADEALAAALATGRTARIAVARDGPPIGEPIDEPIDEPGSQPSGADARFELAGLARALARVAALGRVRDVVRYD